MKKNTALALLLLFILNACSLNTLPKTDPKAYHVLIKSSLIKANNQAFFYRSKAGLRAEFYEFGNPVLKLLIYKNKLCINQTCYLPKNLNKKLFKNSYYPALLEDILSFRPIFKAKALINTSCGFYQNLASIKYQICDKTLIFKDYKAGVKIIIKEN